MNEVARKIVDGYTPEQVSCLRTLARRFPGIVVNLWERNVLSGEMIMRYAPRGHNVSMADVGTVLLKMQGADMVTPIKFSPSRSAAAFLGLDSAYRETQNTPNAGTAAHWTWEVTGSFDVFDLVLQGEEKAPCGCFSHPDYNPLTECPKCGIICAHCFAAFNHAEHTCQSERKTS